MNTRLMLTKILLSYQDRIEKLFDRQAAEMRARLLETLGNPSRKAATGRKARKGTRHCGKCGSTKHDARNCDGKTKKAVLHVARVKNGKGAVPAGKAA